MKRSERNFSLILVSLFFPCIEIALLLIQKKLQKVTMEKKQSSSPVCTNSQIFRIIDWVLFTIEYVSKGEGGRVERIVSFLPLSHVAANVTDIFILMHCGGTVYFGDK